MKRCPECRRDYYDDSLLYCLEDGVALIQGSVPSPDEPATAILHSTDAPGEAATRAQIHTTAAEPQDELSESSEKHSFSANRAAKPLLAVAALVVILLGVFFGYRYFNASSQINSIAVMPFSGLAEDSENGYLSEGLAESIIYNLSRIPDLKVLPASIVIRYKNSELTPKGLADELGVQAVLVSRIVQRGDDLQISTELVDASQNKVIWGQIYEKKLVDALAIQRDISREISEKLELKLSGEDQQKVNRQYTADPEAYQEYLKGTFQLAKRTPEGIRKAIGHFERASTLDPKYAKAWSGLADSYVNLSQYSNAPQLESLGKAKLLAEKAVALDPELANAHTSLAVCLQMTRNFSASEGEYKKAIELDPRYSVAHHWYALYLSMVGRNEEALREIRTALELEPLSLVINRNYANILFWAGKFKEAEEQARKVAEMDPGFAETAGALGKALTAQARYDEAIEVLKGPAANGDSGAVIQLGIAYTLKGDEAEARKQLDIALRSDNVSEARLAVLFAALGENSKALDQLEKAYEQYSNHLLFARHEPVMKRLENEPRFKALMKKIGYPDEN